MVIYQIYVLDELGNALSLDLVDCATEYEARKRPLRWWTNIQWNSGVEIDASPA